MPSPPTEAWVVSGVCDKGLHWNGNAWLIVATRGPEIDDTEQSLDAERRKRVSQWSRRLNKIAPPRQLLGR